MQPLLRRAHRKSLATRHAARASRAVLRARRGVSLIFVAVTLSVVAVMAAVTMPNLITYQKQKDAVLTAKTLQSLDSTLGRWLGIVGQLPQQLHVMVLPFSTSDKTCSGNNFKAKAVNQEANNWPWSGVTIIPSVGVPTPLGFIHDSVLPSTVTTGDGELHVDSLDLDAAQLLDIAVDNGDGPTAGLLRYALSTGTSVAHPIYLARYHVRQSGCN